MKMSVCIWKHQKLIDQPSYYRVFFSDDAHCTLSCYVNKQKYRIEFRADQMPPRNKASQINISRCYTRIDKTNIQVPSMRRV